VDDIEKAASQSGIESKRELIAFSTGFAARDAQKRIQELEMEIQRLKTATSNVSNADAKDQSAGKRDKNRATEGTKHTMSKGGKIGGDLKLSADPEFVKTRLEKFKEIQNAYKKRIQFKPHEAIKIILPDGTVKEGQSWITTPFQIASGISKQLAKQVCVAKIKYVGKRYAPDDVVAADDDEEEVDTKEEKQEGEWMLWDVNRPLEGDCHLSLEKFMSNKTSRNVDGSTAFWHSAAHVLGQALERSFGVQLTIGPALKEGFYYDCYAGKDTITEKEWYSKIETTMKKIAKEKQEFERVVCSKEEALKLFSDNPFKVELIKTKVPNGSSTTVYRNGPFVDLCMGPHVPNTGVFKAVSVISHSAAYWRGNDECDSLQRMYGIAFPNEKQMKRYKKRIEEQKKLDHRKTGTAQSLFFMHDLSPGSAFFLPHGARVYGFLSLSLSLSLCVCVYLDVQLTHPLTHSSIQIDMNASNNSSEHSIG